MWHAIYFYWCSFLLQLRLTKSDFYTEHSYIDNHFQNTRRHPPIAPWQTVGKDRSLFYSRLAYLNDPVGATWLALKRDLVRVHAKTIGSLFLGFALTKLFDPFGLIDHCGLSE